MEIFHHYTPEESDELREVGQQITNKILRMQNHDIPEYPEIFSCKVNFFEEAYGINLFQKPILSVNFSDEDQEGYDHSFTIYQSNSKYLFGILIGEGDFGDHDTSRRILVYKPTLSKKELMEDSVKQFLETEFKPNVNLDLDDVKREVPRRPRRLMVAEIASGKVIFNQSYYLNQSKVDLESFLYFQSATLLEITASGKYFACISRPERIGHHLETHNRFNLNDVVRLIGR